MDTSERDRLRASCESGAVKCLGFIDLIPSLPYEVSIPIPFTSVSLHFGGRNLKICREQLRRYPNDARAHISLAALLLDQEPITRESTQEARDELRMALKLLSEAADATGCNVQQHAMVHKFLGDALLELGQLAQARRHWQQAVDLDPVRPPFGFSGPALEQLEKHPLP